MLFKNEAGFADAVTGVYTDMISDDTYGKNLTWRGVELMGGGGFAYFGETANYQGFYFQPKGASYYSESLRNSFCDAIWTKQYNTIANINSILSKIDDNKGIFTGSDYNVFKGELLGLRAFLHFDLLRLFAPAYSYDNGAMKDSTFIPYENELTTNVHPLLTRDQVCELALKDLEEAKELLKSDPMYTKTTPSSYVCGARSGYSYYLNKYNIAEWHNRRFHFNYYACLATMARIYLWKGEKEKALACAKEVIDAQPTTFPWVNSSLVAKAKDSNPQMPIDRTFCTEQIFALNIKDMDDRMDGYVIGKTTNLSQSSSLQGFDADMFSAADRQTDIRYILKNMLNIYGQDFPLSTKFVKDSDPSNYCPWALNCMPLIRISEMYCIAAECEPDLNKAVAYLNELRTNRGLSANPLKISSQSDLLSAVRNEMMKETICEGQSFYWYKLNNEPVTNKSVYSSSTIQPSLYTMPRPDDEDTYGGI